MRGVVLACGAVLVLAAGVSAATYLVNADGSGDLPTIQAAVDAAVALDTIELGNGVFTGPGNRNIDIIDQGIRMAVSRANCGTMGRAA